MSSIKLIVAGEVKRADHRTAGTHNITELAVCRKNKTKEGEEAQFTWVKIQVWDAPDWLAAKLLKGAYIHAVGDATLRSYMKDDEKKMTLEMRCSSFDIDVMNTGAATAEAAPPPAQAPARPKPAASTAPADEPPF